MHPIPQGHNQPDRIARCNFAPAMRHRTQHHRSKDVLKCCACVCACQCRMSVSNRPSWSRTSAHNQSDTRVHCKLESGSAVDKKRHRARGQSADCACAVVHRLRMKHCMWTNRPRPIPDSLRGKSEYCMPESPGDPGMHRRRRPHHVSRHESAFGSRRHTKHCRSPMQTMSQQRSQLDSSAGCSSVPPWCHCTQPHRGPVA